MRAIGILAGAVAALGLGLSISARAPAEGAAGAVYTMTNAASGNAVIVMARQANGSLTSAQMVATGGLGTGSGLGNQGALALTDSQRWLFAVNAGSDEVSSFAVTATGLELVDRVSSGGRRPISLTVSRNLLYVLNAGGLAGDVDKIAGFRIGPHGTLSTIPGSTRLLSAASTDPAQVSFSPDGNVLVVTEKATSLIDVYRVGQSGLAQPGAAYASVGMTPFGFAFGKRDVLVVSEAFGGAPDASAVSSYHIDAQGVPHVVSGSVLTTETAACWLAVTNDGRYGYTTNTGSGSISGYRIGFDGTLTLLDADGRTGVTGMGSSPIDLAFSRDGHYLYSLNAGSHSLGAFRAAADGSLEPLVGVSGLPAGANGLAAR